MSLCLDETFVYPAVLLPVCLSVCLKSLTLSCLSCPAPLSTFISTYSSAFQFISLLPVPPISTTVCFLGWIFPAWLSDFERFHPVYPAHGLINRKDTKTKCRLYWCLIEFIDRRYSQSVQSVCRQYSICLGMGGGGC
jgi:hypothetical protein